MNKQTRLIQVEDTPLWSGVPAEPEPDLSDRDRWLLVTQQLQAEQEYRRQLEQDILGWEAACSALRVMLEQAKAQVERMADANAEMGAEYIQACHWSQVWKAAAKKWWKETALAYDCGINAISILDVRTPAEIAESIGAPISGVLQGHMTKEDWDAIKAAAGVGEGEK